MAKPGRDGNALDLRPARGHDRDGKSATIRDVREHPIDMFLHRDPPVIENYHHQAAERFLRDWELASISSARAAPLEPSVDGGRAGDLSAAQADAIDRVNKAMATVGGVNRQIIMSVVIGRMDLERLGEKMRSMGFRWPAKRYGGPRLCEALHELAECYGMATRQARARDAS